MTTKEKECELYPSLKFAWRQIFPENELYHVMKPGKVVVSPSKFGVSSTRSGVDVEPVFGSAEQFNEGLVEMCRIFGRRFALVLYAGRSQALNPSVRYVPAAPMFYLVSWEDSTL